ncbi:MAG: glycosyltransferase [Desulfobulbus sp.]|nr:glycosyltransferase [Desulfobulbus sp.]
MEKKIISMIYSYYNQPKMLDVIVGIINSYDDDLIGSVEVIFVDDGSQAFPMVKKEMKCSAKFFRLKEDVGFNNCGAKNVGLFNATGEWCFILDLDHYVTGSNLKKIIDKYLISDTHGFLHGFLSIFKKKQRWYQFKRLKDGKNIIGKNPNIKLIRRESVLSCPYDEDFSGYYGYEDMFQLFLLKKKYGRPKIVKNILIEMVTAINDSNTKTQTNRSVDRNKKLFDKKITGVVPYSEKFLRIPYESMF